MDARTRQRQTDARDSKVETSLEVTFLPSRLSMLRKGGVRAREKITLTRKHGAASE